MDILKKSGSAFPILSQCTDEEQRPLFTRKGVYPFSFATSITALEQAKDFPPIEAFHNDLNDEACSVPDYEYARQCYEETRCENLLQYTGLYCSADTVLLADVLFDFRAKVYSIFGLDINRYLSLPHLALDAMLKVTGIEIDHLSDQEMSDVLQKGIRGGYTFVNTRLAVAVDEQAATTPDEMVSILFLDANNLYGCAMSSPMPVGDYSWVAEEDLVGCLERSLAANFDDDDPEGFIYEVDLEYPPHLHNLHDSFILAPETVRLTEADLSPYSRACNDEFAHREGAKHASEKLTATFRPRVKYLVHERNLSFYVSLGLRVVKLHRAIRFRQSCFLRDFIRLCTRMRQQAATEIERTIWKLVANSVYGP